MEGEVITMQDIFVFEQEGVDPRTARSVGHFHADRHPAEVRRAAQGLRPRPVRDRCWPSSPIPGEERPAVSAFLRVPPGRGPAGVRGHRAGRHLGRVLLWRAIRGLAHRLRVRSQLERLRSSAGEAGSDRGPAARRAGHDSNGWSPSPSAPAPPRSARPAPPGRRGVGRGHAPAPERGLGASRGAVFMILFTGDGIWAIAGGRLRGPCSRGCTCGGASASACGSSRSASPRRSTCWLARSGPGTPSRRA